MVLVGELLVPKLVHRRFRQRVDDRQQVDGGEAAGDQARQHSRGDDAQRIPASLDEHQKPIGAAGGDHVEHALGVSGQQKQREARRQQAEARQPMDAGDDPRQRGDGGVHGPEQPEDEESAEVQVAAPTRDATSPQSSSRQKRKPPTAARRSMAATWKVSDRSSGRSSDSRLIGW